MKIRNFIYENKEFILYLEMMYFFTLIWCLSC